MNICQHRLVCVISWFCSGGLLMVVLAVGWNVIQMSIGCLLKVIHRGNMERWKKKKGPKRFTFYMGSWSRWSYSSTRINDHNHTFHGHQRKSTTLYCCFHIKLFTLSTLNPKIPPKSCSFVVISTNKWFC